MRRTSIAENYEAEMIPISSNTLGFSGGTIILSEGGEGNMRFAATHFTTGPDAGSLVTFGSAGTNLVVVLIENNINGLTPSPVGPVPGTGVALAGTF